jgi:energy-coupling factor transporter transmembrane protein EcfT
MDSFMNALPFIMKLNPRIMLGLLIGLGLLLFLPQDVLEYMSVSAFRKEYESLIGPTFWFIVSLCIARIIFWVGPMIVTWTNSRNIRKQQVLMKNPSLLDGPTKPPENSKTLKEAMQNW